MIYIYAVSLVSLDNNNKLCNKLCNGIGNKEVIIKTIKNFSETYDIKSRNLIVLVNVNFKNMDGKSKPMQINMGHKQKNIDIVVKDILEEFENKIA